MTENEEERSRSEASSGRRGFLAGAGTVAGLAMLGNASALDAPEPTTVDALAANDIDGPLPYEPLDAEAAISLGRGEYYDGKHCGEGAFRAIVTLLREKVGGPWNDVPTTTVYWGAGGGGGWAAVCGSVIGSNSAISLVHGRSGTTMKLVDELNRWYTQHPFPQYTPPGDSGGITKELPTSRSGSILCHVSVTEWCDNNGYASGSDERAERCSRVAGETASRAIELLNAEHAGNFDMVADSTDPMTVDSEKGCRSCHFKGDNAAGGQYTRGKMECMQCHGGAPHMPSSLK